MTGFMYGRKSIWQTFPESLDVLRESIDLRMTASETAVKLSDQFKIPVNSNMAIGKARLLGLKFNSNSKNNTYAKHGMGRIRDSRAASATPPAPKPIKIAIPAPEKPVDAPRGRGLLLVALTRRNECRWPTGVDEEGRHLFCAEKVSEATLENGRCYCHGHSAVAYRPAGKVDLRPVRQANSNRAGVVS